MMRYKLVEHVSWEVSYGNDFEKVEITKGKYILI